MIKKITALGLILLLLIVTACTAMESNNGMNQNTKQSQAKISLLQQQLDSIPTQAGKVNFLKQSNHLTKNVDPELLDLDSQIITCEADVNSLLSANPSIGGGSCIARGETLQNVKGLYLSGQCCGTMMDTKEYHERLEKLQAYKSMPDIPLDPMHTPIDMAKRWIDYDKNTKLTPDEQKIYDEAYAISEEKPCCCKCWHYFVDEGIAKKMIKDKIFNAQQIAIFWDASEICGT